MRYTRLLPIFFLLLFASTACRSLSVRGAEPGKLDLAQNTAEQIYFEPFSLEGVELAGNHGGTGNTERWFAHVLVGAQVAAQDKLPGSRVVLVGQRPSGLATVEEKYETKVDPVDAAPQGALRVRGRYIYSEEVGGASRALIGMMAGKSWTRARVEILRDDEPVYTCFVDGKYLGNGYSWGYETLGANEEVGRAIVEVIAALKAGQAVASEPLEGPGS
ncbi:MAG: hypothetical protein KC933_02190 [Myxococcales bacterium]|nr:hypothetical protein [Myxococcales bacterium]MCB9651981.1 hypothetical protein [Deltaproteobacteria bacterium]